MELRQLEYFVAVAEEANFTRAAERVHISQSGVSAQIKELERELGTKLFDRSARTVRLTGAGEAALEHARTALVAAQAVSEVVSETSRLLRGRLAVGMVVGCAITPFFEALASFHEAHPCVAIALREGSSDHLIEELRGGRVDLALVGCAQRPPDDLVSHVIVSEGLAAIVPPEHEVSRRRAVTLAQVAKYPIVCMPQGTGLRAVFDQACAARSIRPTIVVEATAADSIADLAARGLGVGILSTSLASGRQARLRVVPLHDVTIPALLAVLWRHNGGVAANDLAVRCRTAFHGAAPAA